MPYFRKIFDNYIVSDTGIVFALGKFVNNNGGLEWRPGHRMKPYKNTQINGYLEVNLRKDGKTVSCKVHRLVAQAFPEICGEWFEGCEIDHINRDTGDNRAVNLRVTDKSGNMRNPLTREACRKAKSKPVIQMTQGGDFIRRWDCAFDVEREIGIQHQNISNCCKNKPRYKTAGGFKWKFA